jgi:glucokinase
MTQVRSHILVADVGGTNTGIAVFADLGQGRFEPARHKTYRSRKMGSFPALLRRFLDREARGLVPKVRQACIDFAGPLGADRSKAFVTNLGIEFRTEEIQEATGVEELTFLNDFEAVGFGLEVLLENRPEAFVRLSAAGRLPAKGGRKPTAVILGAGTGLGTTILIHDATHGRYRPIPGEGGHADFTAVEEIEFRVSQWIRNHRNRSSRNPLDCEKIVSGPGLANVYHALSELEPNIGNANTAKMILRADPHDRPAIIVKHAGRDALCRTALDLWLCCYARAAKNCAIFPLAPGGVFLAGGISAKILPEIQSGVFMREFTRCDIPPIRSLLKRTPLFVVTDYRIGLYGCANVAVNFSEELRSSKQ